MSKQDGCLPRTASDLERKFGFSQTFKELSMLISEAETSARRANEAYAAVDQKHIIYLLTNGGQTGGIYLDDKENVLFNANYIKSGELGVNRIPTAIARVSQIPTKVSELDNDSKYVSSESEIFTTLVKAVETLQKTVDDLSAEFKSLTVEQWEFDFEDDTTETRSVVLKEAIEGASNE